MKLEIKIKEGDTINKQLALHSQKN